MGGNGEQANGPRTLARVPRAGENPPPYAFRVRADVINETVIVHGLAGAVVAGIVAALARRAGSLTPGGQWAAFVMGTLVAVAGWPWGALLIGFFVASSALTRLGRERKAARTASVLPDASARNAVQVFANGGVFAALALAGALLAMPLLQAAALGALAAAAADTWATEAGTLWGGTPRSIVGFGRVDAGVSGGITPVGTLASIVAAWILGALSPYLLDSVPMVARAVLAAGIVGSLADSVLGATLQSRRWCEQCRLWTERRVHTCQYRTQHARGVRWMTNDTVNLCATLAGALTAFLLLRAT